MEELYYILELAVGKPQLLFHLLSLSDLLADVEPSKGVPLQILDLGQKAPYDPSILKLNLTLDGSHIGSRGPKALLPGMGTQGADGLGVLGLFHKAGNDLGTFNLPSPHFLSHAFQTPELAEAAVEVEYGIGPIINHEEGQG